MMIQHSLIEIYLIEITTSGIHGTTLWFCGKRHRRQTLFTEKITYIWLKIGASFLNKNHWILCIYKNFWTGTRYLGVYVDDIIIYQYSKELFTTFQQSVVPNILMKMLELFNNIQSDTTCNEQRKRSRLNSLDSTVLRLNDLKYAIVCVFFFVIS